MRQSRIHKSSEEQSADDTLSAVHENTDKIESAIKESGRIMDSAIDSLKNHIGQPEVVIRKLEEVKSATLITNSLLKGFRDKDSVEVSVKPTEMVNAFFSLLKGQKGDTPTTEELTNTIKPLIPAPIPGKDGAPGRDGESVIGPQGKDGIPGLPGKDGESIVGPPGKDGQDGSPDAPDEVVTKVNSSSKKIDAERVRGLPEVVRQIESYASNPQGAYASGGANQLTFQDEGTRITNSENVTAINFTGAGLTATYAGSGVLTLDSSSGSGTVTSVSVTTANGVSGTVATATTTPAISITLGAITPTTVNGLTITSTTGTLTIAAGKTVTVSNTLTLAGTDATTMTFPTTSATLARTDAANTFTGASTATSWVLTTPLLGTPTSGVLTNCTGLPAASVLAGSFGAGAFVISTSLQAATIELGHATDTTLSRVSAGLIAVEGVTVVDVSTAQTLTNKTLTSPTLTTPSAFTTGGTITLAENSSIALDPAGSADGKYTGLTVAGTGGTTLAFGDLIYLDPTDSRWELTDANSASAADGDSRGIIGMAASTSTDGNPVTVLLNGIIRADAVFPAMTINAPFYVSETAGDITSTAPTTTDAVVRTCGYAITADELYFNPASYFQTAI